MTQAVTELVVRGDGALAVLGQYEAAMDRAGGAADRLNQAEIRSTGGLKSFEATMIKFNAAQEKNLAITTQKIDSVSREQRAFEKAFARENELAALQIKLQREAQQTAVAMSNAVVAGLTSQQQAYDILLSQQTRHIGLLEQTAAKARAAATAGATVGDDDNVVYGRFGAAAKSLDDVAASSKNASYQAKNLKFQLMDVGQSLAGGMPIWMVLMQQGPQIAQIYGTEEGGIGRAFKETGKMAAGLAASLWPLGLAAVAGAAAIAGMQHEINAMSGVDVSFMDVAKASIEVFVDAIYGQLKPSIDAISPMFATAWEGVILGVKTAGNYVVNAWRTAYEMVRFAWDQFPNAIGAAMIGAANAALSATGSLINGAAAMIDGFIEQINSALAMVPGGLELGRIGQLDMSKVQIANPYAEALKTAATEQRKTLETIAQSDPLGDYFDEVKIKSIENANERIKGTEKATRGAAGAAKDAARAFEQFANRANGLVEKYFPGEMARREAVELQSLLAQYGAQLDMFQRQAVEMRITDQFKAANMGVRELADETRAAGEDMASSLADTLGTALGGLFSKPTKDLWEFVDDAMSAFAQLGQQNLKKTFDSLLGGSSAAAPAAANDNFRATSTMGEFLGLTRPGVDPWKDMREAVQTGSLMGTAQGSAIGSATGLAGLLGAKGAGALSAGVGGLGIGYETQNPLMGAVGGALSGWSAGAAMGSIGGPIGAAIGAAAGFCGGKLKHTKGSKVDDSDKRVLAA